MRGRFNLFCLCLVMAGVAGKSSVAAQTDAFKPVTAKELARNPDAYVRQPIELKDAYCYAAEKGYICMTTEPLSVIAEGIASSVRKSIIDDECGEFDALEQSPDCKFSLRFVPKSVNVETGTYVRGDKAVEGQIKVLRTEVIEPIGGRDR
jgi:hypothetical protein